MEQFFQRNESKFARGRIGRRVRSREFAGSKEKENKREDLHVLLLVLERKHPHHNTHATANTPDGTMVPTSPHRTTRSTAAATATVDALAARVLAAAAAAAATAAPATTTLATAVTTIAAPSMTAQPPSTSPVAAATPAAAAAAAAKRKKAGDKVGKVCPFIVSRFLIPLHN